MGGDFNQVDASCPDLWNELLVHAQVLDTHPQLHTFESPTGSSALDRVLCPTDYIAAAQIDVMVTANRRHHLSGHYQLTATFVVRPRVKSDMKDPVHQTIPTNVFCPGKNEADPYMVPNDLQELIRRIQRLPQTDEVEFVSTLWSWWRQHPFHQITLEFLSMNFYGNSSKFELKCYTYLQSISMHSRLPLTIYLPPAGLVSYIQEK